MSLIDPFATFDQLDPAMQRRMGAAAVALSLGAIACDDATGQPGHYAATFVGQDVIEQMLVGTGLLCTGPTRRVPDLRGFGVAQCRSCGCTEAFACSPGCGWAEDDLCTTCDSRSPA